MGREGAHTPRLELLMHLLLGCQKGRSARGDFGGREAEKVVDLVNGGGRAEGRHADLEVRVALPAEGGQRLNADGGDLSLAEC